MSDTQSIKDTVEQLDHWAHSIRDTVAELDAQSVFMLDLIGKIDEALNECEKLAEATTCCGEVVK